MHIFLQIENQWDSRRLVFCETLQIFKYLRGGAALIFQKIHYFLLNIMFSIEVYLRVCSSDKMTPIYSLRLSKVWSILNHHVSVEQFHKKKLHNAFIHLLGIFWLFSIVKFVFLSFSFLFFDELSNFRNRILINQKRELVVSTCHWDCMLKFLEIRTRYIRNKNWSWN